MPFYLGVDMGSSSIKACLADETGRAVLKMKREARVLSPREGFFEVDPVETWWNGFLSICRELSDRVPPSEVRALCVSSVCGSFVPVNERFEPLHNAILYGIDRRSADIVEQLNARYGVDFLTQKLGGAFTTHSILPKVLWLKREKPDIYAGTAHFVSSFNFVSARLTGFPSWDLPTAFGALMLDADTQDYARWFFEDQGLEPSKFPPLGSGMGLLGTLTEEASRLTGLLPSTRVMRGACDINAEAMAADAVRANTAVAVFGSTLSLLLNTDRPVRAPGFVPGMSLMPGVWRIGAATSSGARTLDWSRRLFGDAAPLPDRPTGILFIPWLDGSRTPFNDPGATGAFLGLRTHHAPGDMAAAVRESLGYETALLISMMEEHYPFPETLDVSGGLAHDAPLMRLIADATGRRLRLHTDVDASYGDARIAMTADVPYEKLPPAARDGEQPYVLPSEKRELYAPLAKEFIEKARNKAI